MVGDREPSVLLATPFRETYGAFSPNGRWLAYQSNESGRPEVYVRPFIAPGTAPTTPGEREAQWQVSTAGGVHPTWRPDGREIYYLDPVGTMMAAPVTVAGAAFEAAEPATLFATRVLGGGRDAQQRRQYDVAPDGRFLVDTVLDEASAPITLLMNWQPGTKP